MWWELVVIPWGERCRCQTSRGIKSSWVGKAAHGIAHSHRAVGQPHSRGLGGVPGSRMWGWVV